jgi:methionyl-tRNA synthetase
MRFEKRSRLFDLKPTSIDEASEWLVNCLEGAGVEKSDRLLKIRVRLGDEERTVVSGIQKNYAPEYLVGKKVVMVTNLKPVKLRGIESQGMIVCAENEEGKLAFLSPETDIEDGSEIF